MNGKCKILEFKSGKDAKYVSHTVPSVFSCIRETAVETAARNLYEFQNSPDQNEDT
jgi:hypothetical protein